MNEQQHYHLRTLLRQLTTAAATAALYHLEHPRVALLCQQACAHLDSLFGDQEELTLLRVDHELVVDRQPLECDSTVERILTAMRTQGIGHIKLCRGLTPAEMGQLLQLLGHKRRLDTPPQASEHIRFGQVEVAGGEGPEQGQSAEAEAFYTLAELEEEELEHFLELKEQLRAQQRPDLAGLKAIVTTLVDSLAEPSAAGQPLAALESLDRYDYSHSTNVCLLTIAQARRLGIAGPLLHDIGVAALLHDIGKLFLPEELLQSTATFSEQEWQLMQQHPQLGAEYLANLPGVPRLAIITAYEHHMRYDGTGYPAAPKSWRQNLCSQMTTIADFYDALRTHRAYRATADLERVAAILHEEAGHSLHPELVANFLAALGQVEPAGEAHSSR